MWKLSPMLWFSYFKSENLEVQEMDVAENDGTPVENINSDQPAESRFQFVLVLL